ncbi:hypothetical protein M3I54_22660 [Paraburkholderia sp. CNPSo 3274]|uniref:hypothetical protein n=1 Tax=Paraburkholderia sp. CNPSo 3274 TaxID=2940932 RepID=UPI0020B64FB9|nr:hypothetical protein [Paraburkholderia sp. CNPSo 3274]MCP3709749.1 hypothetical protein [Paraburkholderia sp. CNPSo 3274]
MNATTTRADQRTENPLRDQAKAIREQHDAKPAAPKESPRDARLRTQIERDAKKRPMTGGKSC